MSLTEDLCHSCLQGGSCSDQTLVLLSQLCFVLLRVLPEEEVSQKYVDPDGPKLPLSGPGAPFSHTDKTLGQMTREFFFSPRTDRKLLFASLQKNVFLTPSSCVDRRKEVNTTNQTQSVSCDWFNCRRKLSAHVLLPQLCSPREITHLVMQSQWSLSLLCRFRLLNISVTEHSTSRQPALSCARVCFQLSLIDLIKFSYLGGVVQKILKQQRMPVSPLCCRVYGWM